MKDLKKKERNAKVSELEQRILNNYRELLARSIKDSEDVIGEKQDVFVRSESKV